MPNVGWGELLVILLLGLIVFGPDRLPGMMRGFGKALRSFQEESRGAMEQLRSAVDLSDLDKPSEVGVIDRPDGYEPPAPADGAVAEPGGNGAQPPQVVLYNRNPEGIVPGVEQPPAVESEPAAPAKKRSSAHAPRKRASAAAKKPAKKSTATARKAAAPVKKAAPAKRAAPRRSIEAHEDT